MGGHSKEIFWNTFDYLQLYTNNGIVFNPKKFVFARREVKYTGFIVGESSVRPNSKMISAITDFPEPRNLWAW